MTPTLPPGWSAHPVKVRHIGRQGPDEWTAHINGPGVLDFATIGTRHASAEAALAACDGWRPNRAALPAAPSAHTIAPPPVADAPVIRPPVAQLGLFGGAR